MRTALAAIGVLGALVACGRQPADASLAPVLPADFAVRGRWVDPRAIRVRVDSERSPIDGEVFLRAVERASAVWNATGVIGLHPAKDEEKADVTLSFRRGHHGACEPFGPSTDVAHAGPTAPGTFIHFDAARSWSENGELDQSVSLFHTALHELGHVLGLGHSDALLAVMSSDRRRPGALSAHDLAGLHSLYGGGTDGDGDLRIVRADGSVAAVLRAVAPSDQCEFAVFDCDGDDRDELLVWRTQASGHGLLTVFGFGPGPSLVRTVGPFFGVVAVGAKVGFVEGDDDERLLVTTFAKGMPIVRQFDRFGIPELPPGPIADRVMQQAAAATHGDLDGDGSSESVVRPAR